MAQQAIVKNEKIEEYGPYGSQLPETYRMQIASGEHVKEVIVRHGFIVDAIGFVAEKPNGSTYTLMAGGTKGDRSSVVLRAGEYVTRISGTYGNYKDKDAEVVIGTLKIHTNLNPAGFGPFGRGHDVVNVQNFASPLLTDGPAVGFFGRNDNYIESVGILIRTISD